MSEPSVSCIPFSLVASAFYLHPKLTLSTYSCRLPTGVTCQWTQVRPTGLFGMSLYAFPSVSVHIYNFIPISCPLLHSFISLSWRVMELNFIISFLLLRREGKSFMDDSSSILYLMLGHMAQLNWLCFWTRALLRLLCISSLIYTLPPSSFSSILLLLIIKANPSLREIFPRRLALAKTIIFQKSISFTW